MAPWLGGVPLDAAAEAARELLEEEPLTFAELGRRLGERYSVGRVGVMSPRGVLLIARRAPRRVRGSSAAARRRRATRLP